jgi:cytoskeletal protein CcmA (bactofilin family)
MFSFLSRFLPSKRATVDAQKPGVVHSILDASMSTRGEIDFEKGLETRGRHEGPIRGAEGSCLVIAEGACVVGQVEADTVILHGELRGDIKARVALLIGATGQLKGDALYQSVKVDQGANVDGRLRSLKSGGELPPAPPVRRAQRPVDVPAVAAPAIA